MPDLVNLRDQGDFVMLSVTNPPVFDILSKTMGLQPLLDPSAGYGALQIPKLAFTFFDIRTLQDMTAYVDGDAGKFYVLVRAVSLRVLTKEKLRDMIARPAKLFSYARLVRGIRRVDKTFNAKTMAVISNMKTGRSQCR